MPQGKSEGVGLAIHLHETADMASHADVLRRGTQMSREITGVGRVAEDAVALLVGRMLDRVSGQRVAGQAELIGGEERVMYVAPLTLATVWQAVQPIEIAVWTYFPVGFVIVALKTFGRINVGRESYWMLPKVGTRRGSEQEQRQNDQESEERNERAAQVKEKHIGHRLPRTNF